MEDDEEPNGRRTGGGSGWMRGPRGADPEGARDRAAEPCAVDGSARRHRASGPWVF